MVSLWEILNLSLVLQFLEQGSQVLMLIWSMQIHDGRELGVRIQGLVGVRATGVSVLSRGIGTMPFQLTVACRNWSPHILP